MWRRKCRYDVKRSYGLDMRTKHEVCLVRVRPEVATNRRSDAINVYNSQNTSEKTEFEERLGYESRSGIAVCFLSPWAIVEKNFASKESTPPIPPLD